MTWDTTLHLETVGDLVGMKNAVYVEEIGKRKILLSPAMASLWQSDKKAMASSLMVNKDGRVVSIMDLGGDL